MNLDKKLELAHEWAMELISKDKDVFYASNMVSYNAWQYADAMEAEYNKRKTTGLPEALQDEFQVDWSVAPDWANWWAMDRDKDAYWHSCVDEPYICEGVFEIANPQGHTYDAPSFNYQGVWKDSLRKRS